MVISFWIIQGYQFLLIHLKYANVSKYYYFGFFFSSVLIPLVCMVIARIILGFINLVYTNQELVQTIKKILQVFPEGIIIQSLDERSKKLIVRFVNDTAAENILNYENPVDKSIREDKLNYVFT